MNWNGREHLETCFASLAASDYPADRLELICVDNGSTDGSREWLRERFPQVTVVALPENRGFTGGNAAGVDAARGDVLVFFNNDMRVGPGTVRALVTALSADQQRQAIINAVAPNDIVTMNNNDIKPLPDQGVTYASLQPSQQALLTRLIEVYTSNMEADVAAARMAKITAAGLDKVRFAWAGEIEKGKKHYYMVQGPTFLVEYDNTQNNGNHIHSVWRDFNGDFGRDLLREHVAQVPH